MSSEDSKYCYLIAYNHNGKYHSYDDNPAILRSIGDGKYLITIDNERALDYQGYDQYWFKDGVKHRGDNKPAIIYSDFKNMRWYMSGLKHRSNGPAVIKEASVNLYGTTGSSEMQWYNHGLRHRDDGPAIIKSNGVMKWYIKGKLIKSTINFNNGDEHDDNNDDGKYDDSLLGEKYIHNFETKCHERSKEVKRKVLYDDKKQKYFAMLSKYQNYADDYNNKEDYPDSDY